MDGDGQDAAGMIANAAAALQAGANLQLQAAQAQGGPRAAKISLEKFVSGTHDDWRAFRRAFESAVVANQWTNVQARAALSAKVQGKAFVVVEDIHVDLTVPIGFNDAAPLAPLLNAMEARFSHAIGSDLARTELRSAKQRQDEEIREWHSRLRTLYLRAYPDLPPAQRETCRDMCSAFLYGLKGSELRRQTGSSRPQTYAAYLTAAEDAQSLLMMDRAVGGKGRAEGHGISAIGNLKFDGTCWNCNRKGHRSRDCRQKKTEGPNNATGGRGRGMRGRGRRGRGRGGARGGRRQQRFLAALEQQAADYNLPDVDVSDHDSDDDEDQGNY